MYIEHRLKCARARVCGRVNWGVFRQRKNKKKVCYMFGSAPQRRKAVLGNESCKWSHQWYNEDDDDDDVGDLAEKATIGVKNGSIESGAIWFCTIDIIIIGDLICSKNWGALLLFSPQHSSLLHLARTITYLSLGSRQKRVQYKYTFRCNHFIQRPAQNYYPFVLHFSENCSALTIRAKDTRLRYIRLLKRWTKTHKQVVQHVLLAMWAIYRL